MNLIYFPFERVVEINVFILEHEPGMKGAADIKKLQGALARLIHEADLKTKIADGILLRNQNVPART